MRVLFYVEPAVFRDDPLFLKYHVTAWVRSIISALHDQNASFGLASSEPLCRLVEREVQGLQCYRIASWNILAATNYDRHRYAQELYNPAQGQEGAGGSGVLAPLAAALIDIRAAFAPDLVIATSQNSVVAEVFRDLRCLWIEQAPLPRLRKTARLALDPGGHQVGSILEQASRHLGSVPIDADSLDEAEAAWMRMSAPLPESISRAAEVREAVTLLAGGRRVALLVLQPPDWLTWEGAGAGGPPATVLAQWAASLPPGWVGIPVHHPAGRMSRQVEESIAQAFPQLALLPEALGSGVAELALPTVDAVVTVSSTTAMTAAISGKRVVVTGQTPYAAIAGKCPSDLEGLRPLGRPERIALLAFLTHRYTFKLADLARSNSFRTHIEDLTRIKQPEAWMTDLEDWTPNRIISLV